MKTTSRSTASKTGARRPGGSRGGARKTGASNPTSSPPSSPSKTSSGSPKQPDPAELAAKVQLWRSSLQDYCMDQLKVQAKSGAIVPLVLNRAQQHLHRLLEEQKERTGKVRAIVLKGRQQGVSTYLQARFYWMTSLRTGKRALILTHRQDATDHIFGMADRFVQQATMRPSLGASNAKELLFAKLDSGYQVATAGARGIGRSMTCQLFHGSEVAFWDCAEDHMAGVGQIMPDLPGTEIVLESTANGIGNLYHRMWQAAERGESDYIAVFIPWFWQEEYTRSDVEITLDDEEEAYRSAYGLTMAQMAWRRMKILNDFSGDKNRFAQEYPATAAEAFVLVGVESFIPASIVLAARAISGHTKTGQGPLVVGVDPARFGGDATAIAWRRGRVLQRVERILKQDTMAVAGRIARIIKDDHPARVFIDIGGLGAGIYDRLVELGFGYVVTAVNFGESAAAHDRYVNRRAEMWGNLRDWLRSPPVSIPDDSILAADLVGPQYTYDSDGRVKLESKEQMRNRKVKSPDAGDALALTFAAPVGYGDSPGGMLSPATEAWDRLDAAVERLQGHGLPWAQTE